MELWHTVTEDNEAILSPLQCEEEHLSAEESNAALSEKRKEFTEAPLHHQMVRMGDLRHLDAENTVASVHSLPKLHEELEESHQGFQATSEDPSVLSPETLHVHNMSWHPPNRLHFPTSVHQDKQNPPLNPQPVTLFADINPSFHVHPHVMPHFNPVFLPHLSFNVVSNASVPRHNPFCPISTPQINFNLPFKPNFTALVACEDPIRSSLVLGPHLKVYPAHLRPSIYPMIRTDGDGSGRASPDLQDSFRLWQRLCETARLFCSSASDAEALACYFISVVPSLVVQRPDLPFSAAVNAAVQDWRKASTFERQQYYNTAKIFVEMEEQDKSANREKEYPVIPQRDKRQGRCPQHSSGKVKTTSKRCKKESPVQDLAESALNEYSQVMDALGSEVTAADKEDVCALFFNQLLNDSECTTEAGFDMDYINSLLSTDQNISDVLQDIPEPVAGCSDWTQIQPSSDDFSTNLLLSEDHMTENIYTFQENVKDLNEFQMFAEPLLANPELQSSQTDQNASVQETLHSLHQDFGPEADGNQEDETEIDSATQSNCFNLQNYKSHNATFPHTDPEILVDGELEHNEEKNAVVRQKTEKYENEGIPNDSQKTRSVRNKQTNLKESPKMDQNEEINLNKNKKHQRRHRRQKHVVRTLRKSDDKDEKVKTQRKSAKHDTRKRETDFIKMNMKRVELQNITEATSSGKCVNLRKMDDEFERRQRRLKSVRRVGKQQMKKAETYRRVEGRRLKKQGNLLVEEDCGDFHRKREACQRLRREMRPKLNVQTINVLEKKETVEKYIDALKDVVRKNRETCWSKTIMLIFVAKEKHVNDYEESRDQELNEEAMF